MPDRYHQNIEKSVKSPKSNLQKVKEQLRREKEKSKKLEQALRECEERYHSLMEIVPCSVTIIRMEDGQILEVNEYFSKQSGFSREEAIGKTVRDLNRYSGPNSREDFYAILKEKGEVRYFKVKYRQKDGTKYDTLVSSKPIPYRNREGHPIAALINVTERKQTNVALRKSEERYRLVSELSSDFAYSIRFLPDGSHVHEWETKALESITGYTEPELTARGGLRSIILPDSMETYKKRAKFIREGKTHEGEFHLSAKDGTDHWVFMVSRPSKTTDGNVRIITVGREITDKKRMEEELRKSEEKYRLLAENVTDVIWTTDLDLKITYISPSVNRLGGRQDKEYLAAGSLADFLTPSSVEVAFKVYAEELAVEEELASKGLQKKDMTRPRVFELEFIQKDGKTFWTEVITDFIRDDNGKPIGILGVTRDIADRKRTEDALKESELRYRILFQNAPIGICLFSPYGRFLRANEELVRVSGYSAEELRGIKFRDFLQNPEDFEPLRKKLKEEGFIRNYEIGAKRKDGTNYYASLTLTPVILGGEDLLLLVLMDITDERKISEEKQILEEQLQRARKMEAIGTLAGGVAHDLNNILSGVTSYPELLLMDIPEDSHLRKPLMTIQSSGQKAAAIVQDLLTLARRGVMVSEIVNLNDVVSSYLRSPEYAKLKSYHPDIQVKEELESDLLNISGSPVHLSKTIMNLVSNAVEAMSGEGEVIISTANEYVEEPIKGYDQIKEGEYVTLSVSDSGSGIPGEEVEKIFEPFYTKKIMGRSGTGLGMAVVWGTVKDHRGYLDVQSEEGKGTRFVIYFPVTRKKSIEIEERLTIKDYEGKGETILVVDDIKEQREIASAMLSRLGYRVDSVSTGEAAIEYLQNNQADLIVLDMMLGLGLDGLDTYQKIIELHPHQKAIIVSGFSETVRVRQAQRLGAELYIRKPYTIEKIGMAVRTQLDK